MSKMKSFFYNTFSSTGFITEENSLPIAPTDATDTTPVGGLLKQSDSSKMSRIPNEEKPRPSFNVEKSLEALAARSPDNSNAKDNPRSGDDLWPFPFPQDPSDSWSENGGYFCSCEPEPG